MIPIPSNFLKITIIVAVIILSMGLRRIKELAPDHRAILGKTKAIPLCDKSFLNSYYVPDTVLGSGEIIEKKRVCV